MKRSAVFSLVLALLFVLTQSVHAKWWIFGQANEDVSFSFLNINNFSYEDSGEKVTLPKDTLINGQVLLNGKVRVTKGKVGQVRISVDDRGTWNSAKLADDGTFEFRFTPEVDKDYVVYVEATDTAGKSNDVEGTRKELRVSESNALALMKEALNKLIASYMAEDPSAFMALVSEDFTGDAANLDRAIRRDFSAFDGINITYTVSGAALNPAGHGMLSINFTRSVVSSKTGKILRDSGYTDFVFKMEEGGAKAYRMRNPLIFGLSDAGEVSGGSVLLISAPVLVVDAAGNAAIVPPAVLGAIAGGDSFTITVNSDGTITIRMEDGSTKTLTSDGTVVGSTGDSDSIYSGTVTLTIAGFGQMEGFTFETEEKDTDVNAADIFVNYMGSLMFNFTNQVTGVDLGPGLVSGITEAPDPAVTNYGLTDVMLYGGQNTGHCFALKLPNNKFALIEIVSADVSPPNVSVIIKYKYQSAGGRIF